MIHNKPDYSQIWSEKGAISAPNPAKVERGWVDEKPPFQIANWIENRQDKAIAYLLQKGIPEWDSETEYDGGNSFVNRGGQLYQAISNSVGADPALDRTSWKPLSPQATEELEGRLKLATQAEAISGVLHNKAITPFTLKKVIQANTEGFLRESNNLSDVNAQIARTNLGLGNVANVKQAAESLILSATDGIEGGGDLSADRTFKLSKWVLDLLDKTDKLNWDTLTGKPSTFPPTSHSHSWESITSKPSDGNSGELKHTHTMDDVSGNLPWGRVSGKPSSFPAESHTHPWGQVTGKPKDGNDGDLKHTHDMSDINGNIHWNRVDGKPSTFNPASHTHHWNQITDKPSKFPAEDHTHTWGQITNKPTTFTPSAHSHYVQDISGINNYALKSQTLMEGRWHPVSRASGVTYTNHHGKPIQVAISKVGGGLWGFWIDGVRFVEPHNDVDIWAIIPHGSSYGITGSFTYWREFY